MRNGWYWYHYDQTTAPRVGAFIRTTPQMRVRVSFRGHTSGNEVIVFEVLAPFRWSLPGYPTVAPKRAKTTIEDIASGPAPAPGVVQLIEEVTGKSFEAVKGAAGNASTALNLVLFGGAAIVLWNIWRGSNVQTAGVED